MTDSCPCQSGIDYENCCGPLLAGKQQAATAEALMRSRYSGYIKGCLEYLMETWHPSYRPRKMSPEGIPAWISLEIRATDKGGEGDTDGMVEFIATGHANDRLLTLHEKSRFVKEDGQWFYVDGDILSHKTEVSRVGRNDPCPCGSGRKFKKCCLR